MSPDDAAAPRPAAALLDLAARAATAYERPELAARLAASRRRLEDPDVSVLVVGEFKQGKSSLVNALLNVDVCAVDDDVATAVPTLLRRGDALTARARWRRAQGPDDGAADDADDVTERDEGGDDEVVEDVDPATVPQLVRGPALAGDRCLESVEVTVPRKLLASGLALVDTPGVGGLQSEHGAATAAALPSARAVLFVTDASQELTRPELDLLRRAHALCPHLAVVLTKIDLYPQWRRIRDLDAGHLASAGLDAVPILATSAVLRGRAVADGDATLNEESGYASLVAWLRTDVLARAEALATDGAARDVADVVAQLRAPFDAEQQVLGDPARAEAALDALREAQERAEQLRSGAARWQTALSDGVQDLSADLDHDLRERFRGITSAVDERLGDVDPPEVWDEVEPWLRQLVAEQVAANHDELLRRADDLSARIAELFAADAASIGAASALASPLPTVEQVDAPTELGEVTTTGAFASALGVLRGGYGGMMMFGMLAGMAGIALATPVTVGIGLLMGRKQQRDEKARQLTQRRQQARQTCRSYVDAVSFAVSKDLRDQLRLVQRELRDGWSARAGELQASAAEALAAAQRAAAEQDPGGRLADVEAEIARLDELARRAEALRAGGAR